MTEKTNIPQGYKDSPLGIIPKEWEVKRLGDVAEVKGGYAFDSKKMSDTVQQYQIVKMGNLYGGTLDLSRCRSYWGTLNEIEKDYLLKEGDIIITLTGTIGKRDYGNSVQIKKEKNLLLNQRNAKIVSKTIDNCFLFFVVNSERFLHQFFYSSRGGTGSQTNVGIPDIEDIRIIVPSIKEQKGISDIVNLWDTAIEKQSELIEKLKLRKRALMQQLLTGKKRLPGFSGEWKVQRIKDHFMQIEDRNDGKGHIPMTISAKYGLVSQKDKFDRVVAGNSLEKYTLLRKGDFAYNKGNSNLYEVGCIYRLKEESAVVPFVYVCFRAKDNTCSEFYKHFFINHGLDSQLKRIITSGARGDGLLNVNSEDFMSLKIPYPNIEEQIAIANVLNSADKEIELANEKLICLQSQKRGLMQQLLTGRKRII